MKVHVAVALTLTLTALFFTEEKTIHAEPAERRGEWPSPLPRADRLRQLEGLAVAPVKNAARLIEFLERDLAPEVSRRPDGLENEKLTQLEATLDLFTLRALEIAMQKEPALLVKLERVMNRAKRPELRSRISLSLRAAREGRLYWNEKFRGVAMSSLRHDELQDELQKE